MADDAVFYYTGKMNYYIKCPATTSYVTPNNKNFEN